MRRGEGGQQDRVVDNRPGSPLSSASPVGLPSGRQSTHAEGAECTGRRAVAHPMSVGDECETDVALGWQRGFRTGRGFFGSSLLA